MPSSDIKTAGYLPPSIRLNIPCIPSYDCIVLATHTLADQNDESLRKWKESLGLGSGESISDPKDSRKVILLSLGLEVEGRPDIVIDLTQAGALETLNKKPFTIKEGATFRMKARFRVQHDILSGMKYVQVVSRMGVKQKMQEMIVSLPLLKLVLRARSVLMALLGLLLSQHDRQARVREEVYVPPRFPLHLASQHPPLSNSLTLSQSSPRPHPPG